MHYVKIFYIKYNIILFVFLLKTRRTKMKKITKVMAGLAVAGAFAATTASAGEININIYGASYHLTKSEAYKNAPRSIGASKGQWVYNPGIGLEYDFRKKGTMGFSLFTGAGYFRDCGDYPFAFAELGARYKNNFWGTNSWFWEVNAGVAGAYAHDWAVKNDGSTIDYGTTTAALPVASLAVGYKFKSGNFLKYTATYVPKNNNIGATGGTNLIFMWLTYGF
jgi:hypothetical protein